jgi:hypothetical protein
MTRKRAKRPGVIARSEATKQSSAREARKTKSAAFAVTSVWIASSLRSSQ